MTFALGTAAGIGMIVAEFLRVSQIRIGIASCDELPATENRLRDLCTTTGHAQHHWALLILGLVAVAMAVGASLGRSRPAAAALLVIGVVVLAIALIGDHSSFDNTRGLELYFDKKTLKGVSGPGYTLELIAGALAIVAGAVKLVVRDPEAARA